MSMTFSKLKNLHAGKPAVVIGKGPTLDAWLAAGCPQAAGAVRIGVNQVGCRVSDVAYSVSGDCQMDFYLKLPGIWLRGLPYETARGEVITERPAAWEERGVVSFDASRVGDQELLTEPREVLAAFEWLYCHVSSTNPAVHLAWYLGCSELMLVGIDGGTERAGCLYGLPDRGSGDYDVMKRSVEAECDVLFGSRWKHWGPPAAE